MKVIYMFSGVQCFQGSIWVLYFIIHLLSISHASLISSMEACFWFHSQNVDNKIMEGNLVFFSFAFLKKKKHHSSLQWTAKECFNQIFISKLQKEYF